MLISIIVTAFKEPKTIGKTIKCLADVSYSGLAYDFEILLACPDSQTIHVAKKTINSLDLFSKFKIVKDPGKGKPTALNLAFAKAKGDILVLTDGDVYLSKNAVKDLVEPLAQEVLNKPDNCKTSNKEVNSNLIGGTTVCPISLNSKENILGYWSNLLTYIADFRRNKTNEISYPLSGYGMAILKPDFKLPPEVLIDDAFISYKIQEKGQKLQYISDAKAYVKYPTNFSDFILQKKRTTIGHLQLKNYKFKRKVISRSIFIELKYTLEILKYASNFKEFMWSLNLFFVRFYIWFLSYWDFYITKNTYSKIWKRVESTK